MIIDLTSHFVTFYDLTMASLVVKAHRCTFATFAVVRPRSVDTFVCTAAILSFTFIDIWK